MDTTLALVLGVITPFIYKYVPLKGYAMIVFTWVLGFVLAGADLVVTGGTSGWTWSNVALEFAKLYAVQFAVFSVLSHGAPQAVK
jgi:hypothetical protein